MSLNINFSFGRLLGLDEKLTPAKFNAIVKGIVASITGNVGTADLDDGAVTPAKATTGAYFYASATLSAGTYLATYSPAIATYADGLVLAFKAGADNSGATSFDAGGGAKPLRTRSGRVLETGNIKATQIVEVRYNTTLVAGGCWQITSEFGEGSPSEAAAVASSRNLVIQNNTVAPETQIDITAEEVVLKNSNGAPYLARSVSLTNNIDSGVALNGLETGASKTASRWYAVWLISDGTTVASVLEAVGVTGTTPGGPDLSNAAFSGYTYKALVGSLYLDASSHYVRFYQTDRQINLEETEIFTATTGYTVFQFTSCNTAIPAWAKRVRGNMGTSSNDPFSMLVCGTVGVAGGIGVCRAAAGASAIGATYDNGAPWETHVGLLGGFPGVRTAMGNTAASAYYLTVTGYTI